MCVSESPLFLIPTHAIAYSFLSAVRHACPSPVDRFANGLLFSRLGSGPRIARVTRRVRGYRIRRNLDGDARLCPRTRRPPSPRAAREDAVERLLPKQSVSLQGPHIVVVIY